MAYSWTAMDPDEFYEYTHNWANRLLLNGQDVGDTLILPSNADVTKRPTLIAVEGDSALSAIVPVPSTAQLQYWITPGTTKTVFIGTVWTAQGRKFQERFILPIKSR